MSFLPRFVCLTCLLLAACASTPYEQELNALLGQPGVLVQARWGVPREVYALKDGTTILEYKSRRSLSNARPVLTPIPQGYRPAAIMAQHSMPDSNYFGSAGMATLKGSDHLCVTHLAVDKQGYVSNWIVIQGQDCTY